MASHCSIELVEPPTILFNGQWTRIKKTVFRKKGCSHVVMWESCHRQNKNVNSTVQGACAIPILLKDGRKYFVLVKQFRVPVDGYCIEFPAGHLDIDETAEMAVLRELKEETGYTAKKVVSDSHEKILLDPGMSDSSVGLFVLEIDGDAEENRNPSQQLDAAEDMDVILVECDQLLSFIRCQPKDVSISNVVYAFALGYSVVHPMSAA